MSNSKPPKKLKQENLELLKLLNNADTTDVVEVVDTDLKYITEYQRYEARQKEADQNSPLFKQTMRKVTLDMIKKNKSPHDIKQYLCSQFHISPNSASHYIAVANSILDEEYKLYASQVVKKNVQVLQHILDQALKRTISKQP